MKIDDDNKQLLNDETYAFNDQAFIRNSIGSKVTEALEKSFPLKWGNVRLEVKNVRFKPRDYSLKEQKDALLQEQYLSNPVKGDLYLYDNNTDELLDVSKSKTLLRIPYYTQRGTFIHNGNEYSTLRQSRLRPGIFTRRKANGELESQFNVQRGTGSGYKITLDPSTGIYKLNVGQSSSNLYSILHDIGVSDEELKEAWGLDVLKRNKAKYDARALDKVYSKIVRNKGDKENMSRTDKALALRNAFDTQMVDADIRLSTLGF